MKKVDPNTIEALMSQLDALPPVEQPRRTFAAIAELAPAIDRALERGQDIDTIRQMLEQAGITLQANSLRAYLRAARARLSAAARPSAAQTVASPTARRANMPATAPLENSSPPKERDDKSQPRAGAPAATRGHFSPKPDSSDI